MSPPRRVQDPAPLRRFFLATAPDEGGARLADGETEHALRVLRLGVGDRLEGLDGRGRSWPLVVTAASRAALELERDGEPRSQPAPGAEGGGPVVEIVACLPRGRRAEAMLERLVQLGVTRLVPLVTARASREARAGAEGRTAERLERVAIEACKQCGRLWLPEITSACTVAELAQREPGRVACLLTPGATTSFLDWAATAGDLADAGTTARPIAVVVGPEGGLTEDERELLTSAGTAEAALMPHVLRIETAAEAAAAILAQVLARSRSS